MTDDLPPGWTEASLGDIFEIVGGSTPRTSNPDFWDGDIPWLTPDDLSGRNDVLISQGRRSITEAGFSSTSTHMLPAGSILFTSRAPIGYTAIAANPLCTNQGFKSLVPPSGVESRYVYWYLRYATPKIRELGSGTTFKEMSKKRMDAVPFILPPTAEQERIVAAIEEHLSRLAGIEESLTSTKSKTLDLKAVLAKTAVRGWPTAQLGDLADVFVGSTPSRKKPELWGGPVPWVSSGEIQFCRIRHTRESVATTAVQPDRIHPPGTVLLGMIGEGRTRGQAAVLEIAAAHNQNSAAIRTQPSKLDPSWLFHVFSAQYESNRRVGSGNNQPALNKARVQGLRVPVPPLSDQRKLAEQLDEATMALDQLSAEFEGVLQRCAALRRAVLSEAFAGRLVAQDPNDEPASVLLERIAASRMSTPKRQRVSP